LEISNKQLREREVAMLLVIAMAFFVTGVVALAFPISILTDSGIDALNLKALGAASMVVSALLSLALLRGGGSLRRGGTYLVVQAGPKGGETRFFYLALINIRAGKAVRREFKSREVPSEIEINCIVRAGKKGFVPVARMDFISPPQSPK